MEDVQRALNNEREDHKRTKAALDDVEDVKSSMGQTPDAANVRELVMASVQVHLVPLGQELEQARKRFDESDGALREFATDENRRAIHRAVRAAAAKANILPEAIDDALLLAERDIAVDDKGQIAAKTGSSVEGWLAEMQSKRPHWWPGSSGGGGSGSSWFKRGASINNPWNPEY